jgi:hypothetical protein
VSRGYMFLHEDDTSTSEMQATGCLVPTRSVERGVEKEKQEQIARRYRPRFRTTFRRSQKSLSGDRASLAEKRRSARGDYLKNPRFRNSALRLYVARLKKHRFSDTLDLTLKMSLR